MFSISLYHWFSLHNALGLNLYQSSHQNTNTSHAPSASNLASAQPCHGFVEEDISGYCEMSENFQFIGLQDKISPLEFRRYPIHLSIWCVQQASVCGGTYVRQTIICWCLNLGLLLIPGQSTTNINPNWSLVECICLSACAISQWDTLIPWLCTYMSILQYVHIEMHIYIYIHDPIHVFIMMQCCVISIRKNSLQPGFQAPHPSWQCLDKTTSKPMMSYARPPHRTWEHFTIPSQNKCIKLRLSLILICFSDVYFKCCAIIHWQHVVTLRPLSWRSFGQDKLKLTKVETADINGTSCTCHVANLQAMAESSSKKLSAAE